MIQVSHSQRSVAEDCWRKWAFTYIKGMRMPGTMATFKGGKAHEVFERWLRGEDPFPSGWNEGIDNATASRIRAFVDRGVTEGLLFRHPEQLVEAYFERDLIPGVKVRGYIDWMMPGLIVDHKTSSSRRWMHATEESLAKDNQLLTYAKIYFDDRRDEDVVLVRHNQFVWSEGLKSVHALTATVTREDAEKNWEDFKKFAETALELHGRSATLEITEDLDAPEDPTVCTSKYGGCPFQQLCMGSTSIDSFKQSLDAPKLGDLLEAAEQDMNATPNTPKPGLISGASQPPSPMTQTSDALTITLKDMQGQLYDSDALWAVPSCDLCNGSGWMVQGSEPCLECQDVHTQRIRTGGNSRGVNSEHFDGNGSLKKEFENWAAFYASLGKLRQDGDRPGIEKNEDPPEGDESFPFGEDEEPKKEIIKFGPPSKEPEPEPAKVESVSQEAIKQAEQALNEDEDDDEYDEGEELEKPQQADKPPETQTKDQEAVRLPTTAKKKSKRGRPALGMVLVRGAVHRTTASKVYPLTEVWANLLALASFKSLQHYYQTNAFQRRDAVCAVVELWMTKNPGRMIVWHHETLSPDLQPVWDALQMYAQEIYTT